jgi:hypothetical protein
MPRRNNIAKILVIGCVLLLAPMANAQTSFDQHFALAKHGKLGQREALFAKECGVDRSSATIVYVRSLDERWTFKRVTSVGRGRSDAEMDYLGNAEVWSVGGKPRLLNIWFLIMDTGNSNNELFCLDQNERVTTQESLNIYEPIDGSSGGWRHLRIKNFSADRKERVVMSAFVDASGSRIATPKLDRDDLAEANSGSSPDLAKDIIARLSRRTK